MLKKEIIKLQILLAVSDLKEITTKILDDHYSRTGDIDISPLRPVIEDLLTLLNDV